MDRLAPLDLDQLDAEQQPVADAIVAGPRGRVGGPFPAWLRIPTFADRVRLLGDYCRFESALPRDLAELTILTVVRHHRVQLEFHAHTLAGRAAGLPDEVIEAIRVGSAPSLPDEAMAATYALLREYLDTTRVGDATYARAVAALGEVALVDVVGLAGYYQLVAATMNVFEIPMPEGVPEPLA